MSWPEFVKVWYVPFFVLDFDGDALLVWVTIKLMNADSEFTLAVHSVTSNIVPMQFLGVGCFLGLPCAGCVLAALHLLTQAILQGHPIMQSEWPSAKVNI